MALQYVGGAEASGTSAGFNVSLTGLTGGIASSAAIGDLVVVATGWAATADQAPGVTTAGYTEVAELYSNDTRDANLSVSYKRLTTAETTVGVAGSGAAGNGSAAVVHVWRGSDATTPIDVTTTTTSASNQSSAVFDSPSITPVTSGAVVLSIGLSTAGALAGDTSITAPTGYSNQVDINSNGTTTSCQVGIASKAWTSGAENPAAWTNISTNTSESWAAATMALRPAPDPALAQVAYRFYEDGTESGSTEITDSATYYFNASDAGPTDPNSVWSSDANGFDGNTGTSTTTTTTGSSASNYLMAEGTTAPTSGDTITTVRARFRTEGSGQMDGEVYTDGLAETLGGFVATSSGPAYSPWTQLSTPTGGWTWQKVSDLEVKMWKTAGVSAGFSIIEIEVQTLVTRSISADSNLALRVQLQETAGGTGTSTDDYQLQYSQNGGTYTNIGTAAETSISSNATTGSSQGLGSTFIKGCSQTFNGVAGTLSKTQFKLSRTGSPPGNVVSKIYAVSGSLPTGSALATSDAVSAGGISTSESTVDFTFSGANKIALSAGTNNYAVTVEYSNNSGSDLLNAWVSGSDVHSGTRGQQAEGTGTWTTTTGDLGFAVFTSSAVIGHASANLTDGGATTNRLGAGSGSFSAGEVSEDGLVDDYATVASNYTEHLYALTVVANGVADADTLDFRVLKNGATTGMTYTVTPRIAISEFSGTVTPTTASLVTTTFAPTVTASNHQTVTPTTASLTTATFAPVIKLQVTPTTASLTTTTFAPTVTTTNHQLVTPGVLTLTTSTFAPTVTASDHKLVTPGVVALSTSTFAPTVSVSDNKVATPTTASLSTATFAPTVTVAVGSQTVIPTTASLTTTTFAPTVTASDHKVLTPTTATLTTARFAPTVTASDHKTAVPSTLALSLTTFAPTVSFTAHQVVTPSTTALTLGLFAPTVTASDHQTATPSTLALTLTTFAPEVSSSTPTIVTPDPGSLVLSFFAPDIFVTTNQVVTPEVAALILSMYEPTIVISLPVGDDPVTSIWAVGDQAIGGFVGGAAPSGAGWLAGEEAAPVSWSQGDD